jgi:hypothetical protein
MMQRNTLPQVHLALMPLLDVLYSFALKLFEMVHFGHVIFTVSSAFT